MSRGMRLGKQGLRIMRVLWERGRATAREVTEALNEGGGKREEIAHSTVQTLLRQLEAKGALRHEVEGRSWVFVPLAREDEVAASATRDLLSRVFNGSVPGLVAHLLEHEEVSPEEMARLRTLIEAAEAGQSQPEQEEGGTA